MTDILRRQQRAAVPQTSFGPLRLLPALPWLILAAAMRVIAFAGGPARLPAEIVAAIAVLIAFLVTAQRCIEASGGRIGLSELDLGGQLKLSLAILWRIALLMIGAALTMAFTPYAPLGPHLMSGLDGMAFDQFTDLGRFWSAIIAVLVLLMVVRADQNQGRVTLFPAVAEFARRALWLGTAVLVLGVIYILLGFGPGRRPQRGLDLLADIGGEPVHQELDLFRLHFLIRDAAAVDHAVDRDLCAENVLRPRIARLANCLISRGSQRAPRLMPCK